MFPDSMYLGDQGWTPLMSAVSAGRGEAVNVLLQDGADVNAKNSSGQTALHYAVHFAPPHPQRKNLGCAGPNSEQFSPVTVHLEPRTGGSPELGAALFIVR